MSNAAQPKRLHPGTVVIKLIKAAPEQLLAGPAAIAFLTQSGLWGALVAVGAVAGISLLLGFIGWWRFTYAVLPDGMQIESGVLSRHRRLIPWDRVQDVDIERGPLARMFGLAKVKLETGGSGRDEGLLDSLSLAEAHALRDEIRARRRPAVPGASQEAALAPAARPVFHMPLGRVLQAGLFNFSLLWFALILGGVQYFQDWLPIGWDDVNQWIAGHRTELLGLISPLNILIALLLFLLFGTFSGMVEMLVRNYGFALSLEGHTLRRVRGLFTRSEVAIPVHRIQLVRAQARWLERRLGLWRVDALTLGGTGVAGGAQELAPLAGRSEAAQVLALAGGYPLPDQASMHRVAPLHPWLAVVKGVLIVALIAGVAALFWPRALWGWALIPVIAVGMFIRARPHAWCLDAPLLHVREGWFTRKVWMLPVGRIQSVTLTRGPLARRLGLATLKLDCAGGPLGGVQVQHLAQADARALAASLGSFKAALGRA